jgi:hypothetical protein
VLWQLPLRVYRGSADTAIDVVRHSGVGVENNGGDMELVAKADLIVIHVSEHGKPGGGRAVHAAGAQHAANRSTLV